MEILIVLLVAIIVFDLLAAGAGADSRPGIGDTRTAHSAQA